MPGANRLPDGIVYEPLSSTLMRSTLPRRSLVFIALRRASTNGAWKKSPSCVVACVTVGAVVPVSPEPSDVICGTLSCVYWPRKLTDTLAVLTGPPVATTSPGSTLLSASSAACTAAAVALKAIGAVVWPANVSVNVPPVAFVHADGLASRSSSCRCAGRTRRSCRRRTACRRP